MMNYDSDLIKQAFFKSQIFFFPYEPPIKSWSLKSGFVIWIIFLLVGCICDSNHFFLWRFGFVIRINFYRSLPTPGICFQLLVFGVCHTQSNNYESVWAHFIIQAFFALFCQFETLIHPLASRCCFHSIKGWQNHASFWGGATRLLTFQRLIKSKKTATPTTTLIF